MRLNSACRLALPRTGAISLGACRGKGRQSQNYRPNGLKRPCKISSQATDPAAHERYNIAPIALCLLPLEFNRYWCTCGALNSITDPLGRTTSWVRDLQGRVTAKVYP